MVYEQDDKVLGEFHRKENLRLKALRDANLTVEVKSRSRNRCTDFEKWDANFDLKGAITVRIASQDVFV